MSASVASGRADQAGSQDGPPRLASNLELQTKTYAVNNSRMAAPVRYTILESIGEGAYGIVCSARDEQQDQTIAIKKIENTFEHITFAKRTLRELRIMRLLRHENLLGAQYVYITGVKETFDDVYITLELMETDLASILKSSQPISDDHCKFFLYQIVRALKFLHSASVIHRDLKPRNLLVNGNCDLKVCDFGLARVYYDDHAIDFTQCPVTEYVCTRWYRAPEVLCSWSDYSKSIDVWSVGCIFAEMKRRKAIFPGRNTQHQLQLLINTLGSPSASDIQRIPNDKCRRFIQSLPATTGRPLAEAAPHADEVALELIGSMLKFDPDARISVLQILEHEYLEGLHCPEDEPETTPLNIEDFEFERRMIDLRVLREEMWLEALLYHPAKQEQYNNEALKLGYPYNVRNLRCLKPGETQYNSESEDSPS